MTEAEGCAVLRERFAAAGLAVEENVPFSEQGVVVSLDGFDAGRRVGYEYITTEAGDRVELTPEVVAALEARMTRGELYVFLVDERDVGSPADLALAADRFLAALRARGVLA